MRLSFELLIAALTFIAATALNAVLSKRRQHQLEIADGWPAIEGRVEFTSVSLTGGRNATYFMVTLTYSYFVGEYRSGKYTATFALESEANDFAESMKDKKVQIRYNPAEPDKSILEETSIQQQLLSYSRVQ